MALQCNIDQRGRRIRFRFGLWLVALATLLVLAWALPFGSTLGGIIAAVVFCTGIAALGEARLGWCAARAAGFRVPF